MSFPVNHTRVKIAVLFSITAIAAFFHFIIPTDAHGAHVLHIVLRKLYFLPPVMAAAWFGLRGSVPVTAAVSALFMIHAFHDWPGNYMEQANQVGELAGFWALGLLPGWLFDRQRQLMERIARSNEETYLALVSALDLRERDTSLHSQRVRSYALLLARRMGVADDKSRVIGLGALLHDIGKIAVPDRILLKPERLNAEEQENVRKHSELGYALLKPIRSLAEASEIVYSHHEHFDGTGYPRGIAGGAIPLGARIFAVADTLDALMSNRPYRRSTGYDEAARIISEESGRQFDPLVVAAFRSIHPSEWIIVRAQTLGAGPPSLPRAALVSEKAA